MSVAGKVVTEGAEAVAKTGFLRGIAARASKLLGGGGAAVAGGSVAGEIGAAVVHEGAELTKWGALVEGAKKVGIAAAIVGVAYLGYKALFGSKDAEPKQLSPEAQMINAPVTQPQGEWAARVGGSRGAMQGSYADAVRAEQSGGYYPPPI
jgi:hypothetical protein